MGAFAPSVPEKIALVLTWVQGKEGFKRLKDIFTRQKAGGHGPVEVSIFSLTILILFEPISPLSEPPCSGGFFVGI